MRLAPVKIPRTANGSRTVRLSWMRELEIQRV